MTDSTLMFKDNLCRAQMVQFMLNNTSGWMVHLPHCEANQVGSLRVDPMAVHRPGGIGDAGSLGVVHIRFIVVCSAGIIYINSL